MLPMWGQTGCAGAAGHTLYGVGCDGPSAHAAFTISSCIIPPFTISYYLTKFYH